MRNGDTTGHQTKKPTKNKMALKYIREYYNVPAERGRVIKVKETGRIGTIIGAKGAYVVARMENDARGRRWIFHPDDLEYCEMNMGYRALLKMVG
jgi:hypothetical protein